MIGLDMVTEVLREHYLPAIRDELTLSGAKLRIARELRSGMPNIMPVQTWWRWLRHFNRWVR